MYQTGERYHQNIDRLIYLVKGPKMMHKKHLNQTKSRHINEENDTPVDVEPMEFLFNTFDVPISRKALEIKRKRRDTERMNINPKRKRY